MLRRFLQLCQRLLAIITFNDVVILTMILHRSLSIFKQREQCTCNPPIHIWLLAHFAIVIILRSCHLVCWISSNHPQDEGFLSLVGTEAQRILSLFVLLIGFPVFAISTCIGATWFFLMLDGRLKYCFPLSDNFTISTPWMIAFTLILSCIWISLYFVHLYLYLPLIRIYLRYMWRGESFSDSFIPFIDSNRAEHTILVHQTVVNTLPRVKITPKIRRLFSQKERPSLVETIEVFAEESSTISHKDEPSSDVLTTAPCCFYFHPKITLLQVHLKRTMYAGVPNFSSCLFFFYLADESIICTICIEEMADGQIALRLPCNHLFHLHCAEPWLLNRLNCPNCQLYVARPHTQLLYTNVVPPTLEGHSV